MSDVDLVTFLRARLDEDEAIARRAKPAPWTSDGGVYATHPTDEVVDYVYDDSADHIARHDPARVLRDVEAKRRIVDLVYELFYSADQDEVLSVLAAVWSDHPDYDPAWRI